MQRAENWSCAGDVTGGSLEKPGESQGQSSLKLSLEAWRPRGALAGAGRMG